MTARKPALDLTGVQPETEGIPVSQRVRYYGSSTQPATEFWTVTMEFSDKNEWPIVAYCLSLQAVGRTILGMATLTRSSIRSITIK